MSEPPREGTRTEVGESKHPCSLGPEQRGLDRVRMDRGKTGASRGWGGPAGRLGSTRTQPSKASSRRKIQENLRGQKGLGGPWGLASGVGWGRPDSQLSRCR